MYGIRKYVIVSAQLVSNLERTLHIYIKGGGAISAALRRLYVSRFYKRAGLNLDGSHRTKEKKKEGGWGKRRKRESQGEKRGLNVSSWKVSYRNLTTFNTHLEREEGVRGAGEGGFKALIALLLYPVVEVGSARSASRSPFGFYSR